MKEKTVLVFGTFDFLHSGHIHFLNAAKAFGDRLVVCVARDAIVKQIKGKSPVHDETERVDLVRALTVVDEVVIGDTALSTYTVLKDTKPDIIAIGYDQDAFEADLRMHVQRQGQKMLIKRIGAYKPDGRKSSVIKRALNI